MIAATETKEPEKWLAYAQDRKQEDPRYSVAAFRRDVQRSNLESNAYNQDFLDEPDVPLPSLSSTIGWQSLLATLANPSLFRIESA